MAFEAHRLLYHSVIGPVTRVQKKKNNLMTRSHSWRRRMSISNASGFASETCSVSVCVCVCESESEGDIEIASESVCARAGDREGIVVRFGNLHASSSNQAAL